MNLPIVFGAGLAGAIIIDYGVKATQKAFAAAPAGAATPSSSSAAAPSTAPGTVGTVGSSAGYVDPLTSVVRWERTDQGVDAQLAPNSTIVAPGNVQIAGVIPNWYAGQPLIWWKVLSGPLAGTYQYVAEQITDLAPVGSTIPQGGTIARFAGSGTGVEFGQATATGETEAMATTGYREGYATAAGNAIRKWLNSLGAGAGTGAGLSIGAGPDPDEAKAAIVAQMRATAHAITTPGYVYE